jgi:hypothetical protein
MPQIIFLFIYDSKHSVVKWNYNKDMFFRAKNLCQLCLALPCTLLQGGCVTPTNEVARHKAMSGKPAVTSTRIQREKHMQSQWKGQAFSSLVGVLGEPKLVMSVPGRSEHSTARVYGILDEDSQCIDAFTVVAYSGEPVVSDYFCR